MIDVGIHFGHDWEGGVTSKSLGVPLLQECILWRGGRRVKLESPEIYLATSRNLLAYVQKFLQNYLAALCFLVCKTIVLQSLLK